MIGAHMSNQIDWESITDKLCVLYEDAYDKAIGDQAIDYLQKSMKAHDNLILSLTGAVIESGGEATPERWPFTF